jgi:hypothetical protein
VTVALEIDEPARVDFTVDRRAQHSRSRRAPIRVNAIDGTTAMGNDDPDGRDDCRVATADSRAVAGAAEGSSS